MPNPSPSGPNLIEAGGGHVLIQLDPGVTAAGAVGLLKAIGHITQVIASGNAARGQGLLVRVELDGGPPGLMRALEVLSHRAGIQFVEPDYAVNTLDLLDGREAEPFDASNDPSFTGGQSWGMYGDFTVRPNAFGSQAAEAWSANYTGSTKVAVGVLDTGVDYTHVDLYLNIWLNPNEIPLAMRAGLVDTDADGLIGFRDLNNAANASFVSDINANGRIDGGDLINDTRWENGVDEDANGYLDDLIGWDFANNDNDPNDDVGHGTHVAGVIAAQGGNGVGIAGVTWSTQLILAKFLGVAGGFTSDAIRALDYVTAASTAAGAPNVVATNNSWGSTGYSLALQGAVERGASADILFVAAAGNGGADKIGDNNDLTPQYPASLSTLAAAGYEAVISVAAMTSTGGLASFSNFGAGSVDLGAPGSGIYSTLPGNVYGLMSGTSMAAPFVTGAIALYAATNLGANAMTIRADLLASTSATASLAGVTLTGGRLDISAMIYRTSTSGVSVNGTAVADTITVSTASAGVTSSSVFDDTLTGGAGNDKLDGGPGVDRLVGGAGDDTFTIDSILDVIVETVGEGNDLINSAFTLTLPANVERLTLTGTAAVNGTGNELANTLTGNGAANSLSGGLGNDVLIGGAGHDTLVGGDGADKLTGGTGGDVMSGGPGDDTYDVDSLLDVVTELAGEGNDLITTTLSMTLPAEFERLTLTGTAATDATGNDLANTITGNTAANVLAGGLGADTLTGGAGTDTLIGGAGSDRLTGGLGADRMEGGDGDDTFYVDDLGDTVVEAPGEGNDLVSSSVTFTLSANVERLTLSGAVVADGLGNDLANTITGNTAANVLSGAAGADTLSGGAGDDTLSGGAGIDRLTGGTGADRFVFQRGEAAGDTVIDFAVGDRIELQGYGAGSTLTPVSGSFTNWIVTDGPSGVTEMIVLSNKYVLTAGDFLFG